MFNFYTLWIFLALLIKKKTIWWRCLCECIIQSYFVFQISGTTILYENDLYYAIYDPINPFIIRQHKWTYTVECDVNRNEATSSHVHHDIDAHHTAVSGHYNISMMFYKDPGYMQQMSGNPIHVNVGDQVYVKVVTKASDWSIKMRMHTCYTKPKESADNMIFYIIKDG